jgi:hypothetical protein
VASVLPDPLSPLGGQSDRGSFSFSLSLWICPQPTMTHKDMFSSWESAQRCLVTFLVSQQVWLDTDLVPEVPPLTSILNAVWLT